MAHPCCECGSECYCRGDIDDVIVSHTPSMCENCGCVDEDDQLEFEREEWDEYDDIDEYGSPI